MLWNTFTTSISITVYVVDVVDEITEETELANLVPDQSKSFEDYVNGKVKDLPWSACQLQALELRS